MSRIRIVAILAAVFGVVIGYGLANLSGPSTYEDCVLEGIKGTGSQLAAQVVVATCKRKFSK